MKKYLIALLILCCCFLLKATAQNLVPNSSFELYSSCPDSLGQISKTVAWYNPTGGTPDYFNSCFVGTIASVPLNATGYQSARTGNAYAGFVVYATSLFSNIREYIQIALIDSLLSSVTYKISFYVSPAGGEMYSVDQLGACLSQTAITCNPSGFCLINYVPQVNNPIGNIITDTTNWTLIEGMFTAVGGEKYLTIGNFKSDSVTQMAVINNNSPYSGAYFYIDDVSVYLDSQTVVKEIGIKDEVFNLFPNPTENNLTIEQLDNMQMEGLKIYNVLGEEVYSISSPSGRLGGAIDVSELKAGIYFLQVKTKNKVMSKKWIKQ